jgi:outer membrane lipoprotein SlyB
MKRTIFILGTLILSVYVAQCFAQSAGSVAMIKYGKVEGVQTVKKDASHAGGAAVGGLAALAFGRGPHRMLKVAASAAAGAAIQGAATSGTLMQYTVRLIDGPEIKVSTEQPDIRMGDCVAVESGQYTNIRRVGSVHCEATVQPNPAPAHHQSVANDCETARAELANAKTDDAVDLAVKKVRGLCEH